MNKTDGEAEEKPLWNILKEYNVASNNVGTSPQTYIVCHTYIVEEIGGYVKLSCMNKQSNREQ